MNYTNKRPRKYKRVFVGNFSEKKKEILAKLRNFDQD